ncbi:hypothetical protein [Azotobacter chroococcum]|uniref:hypothetical protein n=1 Tax=Azotobacter chroococcum TaxID=353 RepID=UPI0010AE5A2B|nr:hypothetical protein [Azotobacter chroococcum]TKD46819.1 hypothetical protein FCG41_01275 [Azotobacter chroococcum]
MQMSGSGGSYLGPSTPTTSCAALQFDTQLASPKAQVVAQLSVNDILDIVFAQTGNQVVSALWKGAEAGGIVDPHLNQLRSCMSQGEQYQARVLHVSGGQVRLRVYHI